MRKNNLENNEDIENQKSADKNAENLINADSEDNETIENEQIVFCPQCEKVAKEAGEIKIRAIAEMENFKKRLKKEKDEQTAYAATAVLADIIPSLDNLDLALQYGSKDEACKNTLLGVEMTRKLLFDAVKKHGLEVIGAEGEIFNPELHEAIAQEENASMPEGHVVKVMQKGYMLKERLLRPAKVCVSKKPASFCATV